MKNRQFSSQCWILEVSLKGSVQSINFIDIISRLDITDFAGAFAGAFKAPEEAPAKIHHPWPLNTSSFKSQYHNCNLPKPQLWPLIPQPNIQCCGKRGKYYCQSIVAGAFLPELRPELLRGKKYFWGVQLGPIYWYCQ